MSQQSTPLTGPGISRRNALLGGAGMIAGSAAAVVGTRLSSRGDETVAMPATTNPDQPVMLRLADAGTGAFDVYVGASVVHLVDHGFAKQVARASRSHH